MVENQFLSCATCHAGPGFADGLTHLVGPVREREFGRRQTPSLFGVANTAPYGWDGRNATLQNQSRGAIVSPLEMHAAREPTKRELDALAEFQKSLVEPAAAPGKDFDPVRAARGEALFRTPRPIVDPTGEFPSGARVACATCHSGPFFTDGKPHRDFVPTGDPVFDPGHVGPDGTILGFDTPSLLGARLTAPYFHDGIAGDPTSPSNFLGGGVGAHSAEAQPGASGPAAAPGSPRGSSGWRCSWPGCWPSPGPSPWKARTGCATRCASRASTAPPSSAERRWPWPPSCWPSRWSSGSGSSCSTTSTSTTR